MKKLVSISTLLLAIFAMVTLNSCKQQIPAADLKTDLDSLSYALGVMNSGGEKWEKVLPQMGIDTALIDVFVKGMYDGLDVKGDDKKIEAYERGRDIGKSISQNIPRAAQSIFGDDSTKVINKKIMISGLMATGLDKKPLITTEEAQTILTHYQQIAQERQQIEQEKQHAEELVEFEKQHAEEKATNAQYLEDNKGKSGVVTTASGLQYKVVKAGTGAKPTATDAVVVDYAGTTIDGKEFDSNKAATLSLNRVIKGWTEGIQLMPVGSKYIFYIPYDLAYGEHGDNNKIPPYATLIFEVTLHEIKK
jgi:FKBP-type peptidyl-prolyl cis-trans isomerase FklB